MNVPLLDLVAQYRTIKDDVLPALPELIDSQQFIMGPAVARISSPRWWRWSGPISPA